MWCRAPVQEKGQRKSVALRCPDNNILRAHRIRQQRHDAIVKGFTTDYPPGRAISSMAKCRNRSARVFLCNATNQRQVVSIRGFTERKLAMIAT